jgi:hypothetical protein
MAIFAPVFAFASRFVGKVLTMTLGWATVLLFGRVPASRQMLLTGIAFGSVLWLVLLVGIAFPDVGAFLVALVPGQDLVSDDVIRLVMLAGAVIVPGLVGAATLLFTDADERSPGRVLEGVARGYPLTVLLAVLLVFLAVLSVGRKVSSLARGWTDAHVPLIVRPGRYDDVAADLDEALAEAGIDTTSGDAPAVMSKPARWLAAVAGQGAGGLVPERLVRLTAQGLDILIYPMDVLIRGRPGVVARARAAMASRLTTSAAYLTVSAEAQVIEDRLAAMAAGEAAFDDASAAAFVAIDEELAALEVPYEEWEVLFRERLQVERDLRAEAMAGEAGPGAERAGVARAGALAALDDLGRLVRDGAEFALDVAADDRTLDVVERAAGREWRWGARIGAVLVEFVRAARDRNDPRAKGEPIGRGVDDGLAAGREPSERGRPLDDPMTR